jgi:KaiC/GvpD/RAD55 family RecA-like ATPase
MAYTFNDLVSTALDNKDVLYLFNIKHLLRPGQQNIVNFIQEYMTEYGKIPTPAIVEKKFTGAYIHTELDEAPKYIYDSILDQLRTTFLQDNWTGVLKNNLVDYELLSQLMEQTQIPNTDVLDFGDYDRSVHFANRNMRRIGIKWFDDVTGGGLDDADFMVLYGRLKSGKTTILLYLVFALLLNKYRIHFYSNELSKLQIAGRLDSLMQGFNPRLIRSGDMPEELKESLIEFQKNNEYKGLITIYGTTSSIEQVQANYNSAKEKPDIIVIDSANLMGKSANDTGEKAVAMADISRKAKLFALNNNCPIIATVQEKRTGTANDRESADASLIADSDSWGRDADFAIRVSIVEQQNRTFFRQQVSASRHTEIIEDDYVHCDYNTMRFTHHKITQYDTDTIIEERAKAVSELLNRINDKKLNRSHVSNENSEPENFSLN